MTSPFSRFIVLIAPRDPVRNTERSKGSRQRKEIEAAGGQDGTAPSAQAGGKRTGRPEASMAVRNAQAGRSDPGRGCRSEVWRPGEAADGSRKAEVFFAPWSSNRGASPRNSQAVRGDLNRPGPLEASLERRGQVTDGQRRRKPELTKETGERMRKGHSGLLFARNGSGRRRASAAPSLLSAHLHAWYITQRA